VAPFLSGHQIRTGLREAHKRPTLVQLWTSQATPAEYKAGLDRAIANGPLIFSKWMRPP